MTPAAYAAAATTDAAAVTEADVRGWLGAWQARTFVSPLPTDGAPDAPERYALPALLRGWLLARLDDDARRAAHRRAGEWLVGFLSDSNLRDMRINEPEQLIDLLRQSRSRLLDGGSEEEAREVNKAFSSLLEERGMIPDLYKENAFLFKNDEHQSYLIWMARALYILGSNMRSEEHFRAAFELSRNASDIDHAAQAMNGLASVQMTNGDVDEALKNFERAFSLSKKSGRAVEAIMCNVASAHAELGNYDRAFNVFEEVRERLQDKRSATYLQAQSGLAQIYIEKGKFMDAARILNYNRQIQSEENDIRGLKTTLHQLGHLFLAAGDHEISLRYFDDAAMLCQKTHDVKGEAVAFQQIGSVHLRRGNLQKARVHFNLTKIIAEDHGIPRMEAAALQDLALINLRQGSLNAAESGLLKALAIRRKIRDVSGEGTTVTNLGHLLFQRDGMTKAALQILMIGTFMLDSINHIDRNNAWKNVRAMRSRMMELDQLSLSQAKELMQTTQSAFIEDRGEALLRAAFPEGWAEGLGAAEGDAGASGAG
jgi:tetratricopeptide (TPR) repeat protein